MRLFKFESKSAKPWIIYSVWRAET